MKCPRCQQDNPPHAKFCLECATILQTPDPGRPASSIICRPRARPEQGRRAAERNGRDLESDLEFSNGRAACFPRDCEPSCSSVRRTVFDGIPLRRHLRTPRGGQLFNARGYVEGQNLVVERRAGLGRREGYVDLAREVLALKPNVILATSGRMAEAFRTVSKAIPIVTIRSDPVALGLATSLPRPGGNVTGFTVDAGIEVVGKRLELLKEAIPRATRLPGPPAGMGWHVGIGNARVGRADGRVSWTVGASCVRLRPVGKTGQ
jgi:hypothetical protein